MALHGVAAAQDGATGTDGGTGEAVTVEAVPQAEDAVSPPADSPAAVRSEAVLPAFTPIKLMLDEEVSTNTHQKGDQFFVTVVEDVVANDTVVIPAGTRGWGEITFAAKKGAFGSPGMVSLSLRSLDMGERILALDGRYREEGKGNGGAVFASWLAVGVFSGFIKGRSGYIEKGRELKARLGEDLTYVIGENNVPDLEDAAPADTETETTTVSDI